MPGTPQPAVYQVYNPLSREEGLNSLLEALDFPASSSYTYQVSEQGNNGTIWLSLP